MNSQANDMLDKGIYRYIFSNYLTYSVFMRNLHPKWNHAIILMQFVYKFVISAEHDDMK